MTPTLFLPALMPGADRVEHMIDQVLAPGLHDHALRVAATTAGLAVRVTGAPLPAGDWWAIHRIEGGTLVAQSEFDDGTATIIVSPALTQRRGGWVEVTLRPAGLEGVAFTGSHLAARRTARVALAAVRAALVTAHTTGLHDAERERAELLCDRLGRDGALGLDAADLRAIQVACKRVLARRTPSPAVVSAHTLHELVPPAWQHRDDPLGGLLRAR